LENILFGIESIRPGMRIETLERELIPWIEALRIEIISYLW
jgi:hypothetical protein